MASPLQKIVKHTHEKSRTFCPNIIQVKLDGPSPLIYGYAPRLLEVKAFQASSSLSYLQRFSGPPRGTESPEMQPRVPPANLYDS